MLLIRQGRRETAAGRALIADELDYNAEVVNQYHEGGNIHGVMPQLTVAAWEAHGAKIHALTDPELWRAVSTVYGDLRRTAARGAVPPKGSELAELARRLRDY